MMVRAWYGFEGRAGVQRAAEVSVGCCWVELAYTLTGRELRGRRWGVAMVVARLMGALKKGVLKDTSSEKVDRDLRAFCFAKILSSPTTPSPVLEKNNFGKKLCKCGVTFCCNERNSFIKIFYKS